MSHPAPPSAPLSFHGGVVGALVPFALFLAGVSWLGLSGAPDETGFWPVLLMAIALGLCLATDKSAYCFGKAASSDHSYGRRMPPG